MCERTHTDKQTYRRTDRQADGQKDIQTDRHTNGNASHAYRKRCNTVDKDFHNERSMS